ncbi:hypothetical protein [Deinococcus depolymerans]|uniref:Outer membrane protein beta-barrel domain-containing protein n=1 Tax=Deinococcus depolymerans TaxID=392408 RepID=A0ABN1CIB2_9DEIO
MFKRTWLTVTAAALSLTAITVPSTASAADVTLGLNSSLGLGCQVAGVRAGIRADRVGVYGQGSFCASNVQGQSGVASFGLGLSVDLFRSGNFTTYALAGLDTVRNNVALHAGVGARYGLALVPAEAYLEAGVQRINTSLQAITGPRLALGVNYRVNVANLQGTLPAASGSGAAEAEAAPVACNLTPEADRANARDAAVNAANEAIAAALGAYSAVYSNVSFSVSAGAASVSGNNAQVVGSVTLSGTQNSNGERVSGTYGGTINLVRTGCGWAATGYSRND